MREAKPRRDSRGGSHRPVGSRSDHAVDPLGLREALQRRLVLDRDDRPSVGVPKAGGAGIAVDRDHEQAARLRGGKQAELPGARSEHEQTLHEPIVAAARDGARERPFAGKSPSSHNESVAAVLEERVEELRLDRNHGASWMARRAVEALLDVAGQPAATGEELLENLLSAGRELAASRPGVGAIAGAVGRLLAAAGRHAQLETDQLRQLVREEAESLIDGRRRAAASIAIQLHERLTDAIVLTHSASATVREALLHTPPAGVICTLSSPQDEGRAFSEELRDAGLEVELVDDDKAPRELEWASLLLVGADTVFHDGTLCNKVGTRELAEAAADESVPTIVACEVIKLAPIDAADAPRARVFDLTPPELIDQVVTEEGAYLAEEIRALVDRTPFLRDGYSLLGL
jgi:translation initiation factor 2B subunit (eIF-2B alpha/beta/delta family)